MIDWNLREDRVLVLTIDDPKQRANTMTDEFEQTFVNIVAQLEASRDMYDGVIVTSGKDTFIAGADLTSLMNADASELDVTRARLDSYKAAFRRLELLGKPVVAALNGTALGGGFEVALACHHRVALEVRGSWFGLPEVNWGVLPGAGGVTRVVRMLGLTRVMAEVLIEGRRFSPAEAAAVGLVDDLASTREEMMDRAATWIRANPRAAQPWDRTGFRLPATDVASAEGFATLLQNPTDPALLPAPATVLAVAVEGAQVDLDTAFAIETLRCADLICGGVSTNIVKAMFFDLNAVSKCRARSSEFERLVVERVRILGSGEPAATLACIAARGGIAVELRAPNDESSRETIGLVMSILDGQVDTGDLDKAKRDRVMSLIKTLENAEDDEVDLVLAVGDAVGELTISAPVTGRGGSVGVRPGLALRLSPTGSLQPRVAEILAPPGTPDAAVAQAVDLARQLKLVPIIEPVALAFTARLEGTLRWIAQILVADGTSPEVIERSAREAGLPALGLTTRGGSDQCSGVEDAELSGSLREQLLIALASDALRCLADGVVRSEEDANIASILGVGFPVWSGGVLQYVRAYEGGASGFSARAQELRELYGDIYDVTGLLEELP